MKHTKLYLKTMREEPDQQVIWNQERPIAYLNRADASVEEFVELENLIQSAPELIKGAKGITASILTRHNDEDDGKITVTLDADDVDTLIAAVANI